VACPEELEGDDGNDELDGGTGNDSLDGDSGDDVLFDGAGDDIMRGSLGNDVFDFSDTNNGTDTIADFTTGDNKIDLSLVSDITDFADLVANHLTEDDGSSVITFDNGNDVIGITGVANNDLIADDFIFIGSTRSDTQPRLGHSVTGPLFCPGWSYFPSRRIPTGR